MRDKVARGEATPKSPSLSLTTSPGPMNKYVTQAGNAGKPLMDKQKPIKCSQIENKEKKKEKEKKKSLNKITQEMDTLSESRIEQALDSAAEPRDQQLQQDNPFLLTKNEIESMFAALEKSLKNEMERIHRNLGHVLERVEEMEKISESNTIGVRKLEAEIKSLKMVQQEQAYKLVDQENRDRRKNIRIRGVPEIPHQEDLTEIIKKICNALTNKETTHPIKIERAHRLRRPRELPQENPLLCDL